ncbi:MAG: helix-turn-helix transcriptional regulator [Clostridia bacterium]|nr:helix-turn-helix transcriptional regulator [Clostridia bacterium]
MNEKIYHIYQAPDNKQLINLSMCGITYPDKNYRIVRKNSSTACIEYVDSGFGIINADNLSYRVSEGDAYFLQTGQNQYYYSDSNEPWTKYFINVSGSLLNNLVDGYKLKGHIYYKGLDIKQEMCEIINLIKSSSEDNTSEIVCILTQIFNKMYLSLTAESGFDALPDKMREFLDRHADGKFRMEDLCRYIAHSESQTIRIFKQAYGITPYAYFLNKKIDLAKNMLLNTNLSVKQISYELKFADEYYFSNVFKQKEGISPRKFKEVQKNKA